MSKSKDTDSTATLDFEGVERQPLRTFTERAYLEYSMYVILDRALPHVGHVQTRNKGTVVGSIAHADPASDLPAVTGSSYRSEVGGRGRSRQARGPSRMPQRCGSAAPAGPSGRCTGPGCWPCSAGEPDRGSHGVDHVFDADRRRNL